MEEELQLYIDDAKEKMDKTVSHLQNELARIRAGKADPRILDGVMVDYYGVSTPLNQVANINTPDPKTISIQPWEKSMVEPIEKAIMKANLGLNPINNGDLIRINIPDLTEERRKSLVKQVRNECEQARISLRTHRRDALEEFKKLKKEGMSEDLAKRGEEEIQHVIDEHNKKVDELLEWKEKDIMEI